MADGRAFSVGDWITDGEDAGRVVRIGVRDHYDVLWLTWRTAGGMKREENLPASYLDPHTPTEEDIYRWSLYELSR